MYQRKLMEAQLESFRPYVSFSFTNAKRDTKYPIAKPNQLKVQDIIVKITLGTLNANYIVKIDYISQSPMRFCDCLW
jgi:hypothetical protein